MDSERLGGRKGDGTIEIKAEMKERKVGVGNRKGEDSLQTCSCRSFKAHSDLQESSLFKKKKKKLSVTADLQTLLVHRQSCANCIGFCILAHECICVSL